MDDVEVDESDDRDPHLLAAAARLMHPRVALIARETGVSEGSVRLLFRRPERLKRSTRARLMAFLAAAAERGGSASRNDGTHAASE